jgi:hypothetical protein
MISRSREPPVLLYARYGQRHWRTWDDRGRKPAAKNRPDPEPAGRNRVQQH